MARLYASVVMMFIIMTTVQLKPTEPDDVRSLLITLLKKELRNEQQQGQNEKNMELDDKEFGSDEEEEPIVQPSGSAEEDAKNDSAGYTVSKYLSEQLDDKTRQYMDKQLMIKSKRNLLDLQSACTRNHNLRNQVTGSIQSTNFPDDYEDNLDDCWTIGKENQAVNITFSQEFSIEPGASCPWDSLIIYEAGSDDPVLGPYCGRHAPEPIVVHTPALVHFHTDNSIAWTGFQAHFTKTCPTYDDQGSGSITSHPGYGSSTYPHRYNTCWMIGDETTSVDLTFASFRLENHSRCAYDRLTFYTLQDGTFTQEGDSLCGTSFPDPLHFQRGPVKLEFRTDGSVAYQGFQVDYVIETA